MTDEAVALLTRLVSIPSPSGHEQAAALTLVEWLSGHGFTAGVDQVGNAVGVRGSGEKELLLLGHIDTVPGRLPVWRDGDSLYGRGSVDAKGPLCAFAAAAAGVAVPPDWRITVVGAVEEEAATSKGARHVLDVREKPPVGCVIGEPSRWDRMTVGYRGRLLLDLSLRSPLSHSAGRDRLPAELAVELWERIRSDCEQRNRTAGAESMFESIDASLRHISSRDDGVRGVVRMRLGFRLPPAVMPAELEAHLTQLLGAQEAAVHADGRTDVRLRYRFSGAETGCRASRASPLARAFFGAIRNAGGVPRFVLKAGTSDMNVVAGRWPDVPLLAYGPGDSALDHTPDEHMDLAEFRRAIRVLESALCRMLSPGHAQICSRDEG